MARSLLALLYALGAVGFNASAAADNTGAAPKIPAERLDSLVAPIALYPDPLLAQTLAASTYPLEIVQLRQWLEKNPELKDQALLDAVAKQPWDPSIQAMAALPDVVKRLADDIQWTTELGNAFLAQQADVMAAVQRMRKKAQEAGHLKSNKQQKVQTQVIESQSVIVIEQSDPQVIYVPVYNPIVVYGPPIYPYPPIYYPPYYAGGMAISFGVGVAMGAFWSGGWGWGCGWGHSNININVQNNFNRVEHHNRGRGNGWQHNPQHRGGAPYADRATADRFGGATRGPSRTEGSPRAGTADRIGTQDLSRGGSGNRGAFGGDTRGYNGTQTRAASTRGSQSMTSRGGASRGGGRRR